MHDTRIWSTDDEQITISLCSAGCLHLMVGRAIIKLTQEEFVLLTKLAGKAVRELSIPQSTYTPGPGH